MRKRNINCENCGAPLQIGIKSVTVKCRYCGSSFFMRGETKKHEKEKIKRSLNLFWLAPAGIFALILGIVILILLTQSGGDPAIPTQSILAG